MSELKTWEMLKDGFEHFDTLEDFQQETLADFITCPDVNECKYDGIHDGGCTECKIKWLNSKWEG